MESGCLHYLNLIVHLRACTGAYNSQCLILFNCEMCTKKNKIPTIYTLASRKTNKKLIYRISRIPKLPLNARFKDGHSEP